MILLSFDIEEFDLPLECGADIPFERQIAISVEGTYAILACLRKHQVRATFFCTVNFAVHAPQVILDIQKEGHEIASHGYYHSSFEIADLVRSREYLERLTGQRVEGFRMARMDDIDNDEIRKAGYSYNSSLNPTFIPGRYNHLDKPRTWFINKGILQLPASVTPLFRIPLFWLACHNLPTWIYRKLIYRTLTYDKYIITYFHPWEFTDLKAHKKEWKLPFIITNNSGTGMIKRLDDLIVFLKSKNGVFTTCAKFRTEVKSITRTSKIHYT